MPKIVFELCEGCFVSDDNEKYNSFGVRVLENSAEIASFPDLSLKKDKILGFVSLLSGEEYSDSLMRCLTEAVALYGVED